MLHRVLTSLAKNLPQQRWRLKSLIQSFANTNVELSKTNAVDEATKGIEGLKTGYIAPTSAMAALGIGVTASELANQADAYKNLTARIQIVVGGAMAIFKKP